MSEPIISIQNGIEVILTGEELEAFNQDVINFNKMIEEKQNEVAVYEDARQSALAKLAALGLTQEEIEAL